MTKLLSTTAFALVASLAVPAAAQDNAAGTATTQQASTEACATNWTVVDADENGIISQEEATAAADTEFSRIDVNSDGIISVTEWKDCGDRTAYPGVPEGLDTAEAGLQSTDTTEMTASTDQTEADVEGMTTSPASDQAAADLEIEAPETTGSIAADQAGGMDWSEEDFTAADADQSGDVSQQEAAAASESRFGRGEGSLEERALFGSGNFARLDTNGDGMISSDEFSSRDTADLQGSIEARFGSIDADGNGEVSTEEWQAYRTDRFTQAQQETGQDPTVWVYYYYVL